MMVSWTTSWVAVMRGGKTRTICGQLCTQLRLGPREKYCSRVRESVSKRVEACRGPLPGRLKCMGRERVHRAEACRSVSRFSLRAKTEPFFGIRGRGGGWRGGRAFRGREGNGSGPRAGWGDWGGLAGAHGALTVSCMLYASCAYAHESACS